MDLKDFIKETITDVASAITELQIELEQSGVIINPPVDFKDSSVFEPDSSSHTFRRIQTIEFDVAVTAASETSGGGKGGLKVLSFEAGAEGKHSRQNEQVSRVRFSIPLVLSPSSAEEGTRRAAERQMRKMERY
jgi:Trypsin-co-occurring domain 2